MQEPAEYPLAALPYGDFLRRKRTTTERIVATHFVPHLRVLIRGRPTRAGTSAPPERRCSDVALLPGVRLEQDLEGAGDVGRLRAGGAPPYDGRAGRGPASERPTMADLTTSLRWTYNFLMPLVAPLPDVDLVHSTIASFAALPGVVAKIERGTPFLLTEHGVYARERYIAVSGADFPFYAKRYLLQLTGLISRVCYRYADVIAPVANFNKRWELRYGAREEQIQTVYNGIDPQVFVPGPKPAELKDVPVAVAAARVFPLKDIETMIRSADVARRQLPDVRFVVYGSLDADRPYVDRCRKLIEELELARTFVFGGFHSSPAQVYNSGDISVLSSISRGSPTPCSSPCPARVLSQPRMSGRQRGSVRLRTRRPAPGRAGTRGGGRRPAS
jgi:glycosyltransferase involved in cell wall biosynthesis